MSDRIPSRLTRLALDHPTAVAAALGGLGVVMFWQDIGPSWLALFMLLGGVGMYVFKDEIMDAIESARKRSSEPEPESEPETDPEPEYDPEHVLETGSRDLGEWDIPEGEAPWWDIGEYETTQDRIEAMKRQDPDYDDGSDENVLDKFARVLGLDEDSTVDESDDDDERAGMLDDLDPLFDEAGSLEADLEREGSLEAELETELDFEEEMEIDLEDEVR